jgi:hypothetical protein
MISLTETELSLLIIPFRIENLSRTAVSSLSMSCDFNIASNMLLHEFRKRFIFSGMTQVNIIIIPLRFQHRLHLLARPLLRLAR